jgi:hypothetical protein
MSSVYEKPGLREKMGAAVNATNLSPIEDREGNVERVAALGYVQINPGAQEHGPRENEEIDPGAELGALLLRVKAGQQFKEAERAVELLVHWIRGRHAYERWKVKDGRGLLQAFARQTLAEWLWQTCLRCKGTESIGLERDSLQSKRTACRGCAGSGRIHYQSDRGKEFADGRKVSKACPICRGFGRILRERVRSIRPRDCPTCRGTGRRLINDFERARALAQSLAIYHRHWVRRFAWLHERLDRLDQNENNLLQSALGRRINSSP